MMRRFVFLPFVAVAVLILVLVASFSVRARAQSPVFGGVNLCPAGLSAPAPCTQTQLVTVNVTASGAVATTKVVTGGQPNLDFTYAAGGTCTGNVTAGSACTVSVTFSPTLAGGRSGAVQLVDSGGDVLGTTYIVGTGVGPQIGFSNNGGTSISTGSQNIVSAASDSAGDFYWTNTNFYTGSISELPANGGSAITLASNLNGTDALAVDGAGNVIVATFSGVMKIPAGGGAAVPFGYTSATVYAIAIDGAGNVYLVDSPYQQPQKLVEFPAGGGPQVAVPGSFNYINSIAADANGNLFISDNGTGTLYKIPVGGGSQITLAGPGFYTYELFTDGTGNLYAYDSAGMTVFSPNGGDPYSVNIINTYQAYGYLSAIDPAGNFLLLENPSTTALILRRTGPPPALSFATTNDGSTSTDSPKSVEILNSGNQPLTVSSLIVSSNFPQQSTTGVFPDCGSSFTLAPGTSCNLSIDFAPTSGGLIQGDAALTDNTGNNANAMQAIGFSGTGLVLLPTTTILTANTTQTIYTQPVTLTAMVTASAGVPVGTVTFADGSIVLGTATLDGTGTATITTAGLPVGLNNLTASYAPALNYLASVSSPVSVTVDSDEASAGSANICAPGKTSPAPCSKTVTVTYLAATGTTLGTPVVVTQGVQNLDFTLASTTCTGTIAAGATCTVTVKFTPKFPGMRAGGVQIVDNTGAVLATFNIQGSGTSPQVAFNPGGPAIALTQTDYGIDSPIGITVDAGGNVYVLSYDGLMRFAAGTFTQTFVNVSLNSPQAVSIDGAGNLYVLDYGNSDVVEVPAGGGPQFTVASGLNQPLAMTIDAAGSLYIATSTQILKIAGDTKAQTIIADGLAGPTTALAIDGLGNLYVSIYSDPSNGILKIPAGCSTSACQVLIPTQLPFPVLGLATDSAGNLYFSYQFRTGISEIAADGSPEVVLAGDPRSDSYAGPIALDPAGNLYVIDEDYEQIYESPRSQPPALQFATTDTNTVSSDSPQSIVAQNIGNAKLTLSGLKVSSNFLQTAGSGTPVDCAAGTSLQAGASCNLSIDFKPKTGGAITGSAVFTDNSLDISGSTQTAALSGTGFVLQTQTISFTAIPSQIIGASVALSAVSSSGLPVTLTSTTPNICMVSGTTATLAAVGTCSIQATQAGNSTYLPANPVTRNFAVALEPQTIAFASIPSQFVGASVMLSATATSGLTVVFTATAPTVCTVSGATVALIGTGTCTIQANQPGNGTYAAAPTVTRNFTVKLQPQTITFASIPAQTVGTTLALVATSSSGLPVSFTSTTATTCSITNTTASFLAAGTCTIQATQAGNQTYAAASVATRSFTVNLASQTITFPAIPPQTAGTSLTLTATASSGLPVSFSSSTTSVCTVSGTTATMIKKGSCKIVANQAGNGTYAATSLSQTFAVD